MKNPAYPPTENNAASLGIKICEESKRGKGIGRRATRLLTEHLFEDLNCEKIVIDVAASNRAAQSFYEKVNFKKISGAEAARIIPRHRGNSARDVVYYELRRAQTGRYSGNSSK